MRFYRALLRLYPASFRDQYGEELARAFAEKTRGRSASAIVAAAIADVVPNAIGAQWDAVRHGAASGMSLPTVVTDVRVALRQMARAPLFSGVVVLVIALGIGINAALLTTLHTYAWQPAPGIAPDARLVRLAPTAVRGQNKRVVDVRLSYPELLNLRRQRGVFADVAGWSWTSLAADFGAGGEAVLATYATDNYFRVLRVPMAAGAGFPEGVDRSAAPIVVIGHSLWMTHFGGSATAIGKTVRVMNQQFTIAGVAPPLFTGVEAKTMGRPAIWIPLGTRALLEPDEKNAAFLESFARVAPGLAARDVGPMTGIRAQSLTGFQQGESGTNELIAVFLIVAAFVVLITCTNLSALFLGRAVARRREIGVRLSLGATRLRLIRQMLTESLVHALAGGLLGLALYAVSMKAAYAVVPEIIPGMEPEPVTFLYAAAFALATTIAFGLAPALHATKADIAEVIKGTSTHAIRRSRLQATFVVVQLACSMPVLIVTSLVLADFRAGVNDSADAAPASVVTMRAELLGPATPASLNLVRQRLERVPGARVAAINTRGNGESFDVPDRNVRLSIRQYDVSPNYFATLGIPIVRGRAIGVEDDRGGSGAVVLNEEAAKLLWPGEDPIGKHLLRRERDREGREAQPARLEVIGVAGAAPYSMETSAPEIFAPLSDAAFVGEVMIDVRTASDARAFVPSIRAAIREAEPFLGVRDITTLAEQYALSRREGFQANLAAFAVGAAALVLASLGLYAIIAFAVAQRTREIGIRLAIGATSREIVRQFLRTGIKVTAIGLAIGLPATVAAIRVVQASVFGFTLHNVVAVTVVVPVLIAVAALASWLPARRAGRVDPLIALRSE
jgi:putative ABC transport system permease protein